MKNLSFVAAFLISAYSFAQDVKLKKGIVYIDNKEWARYEGCGLLDTECSLYHGDLEISMMDHVVKDGSLITNYYPKGEVHWSEVKFLGTHKIFESGESTKSSIRDLYKYRVFADQNKFNEDSIAMLVEKYGNSFLDRYNRQSNTVPTIILKDERNRGGVNISIGR